MIVVGISCVSQEPSYRASRTPFARHAMPYAKSQTEAVNSIVVKRYH